MAISVLLKTNAFRYIDGLPSKKTEERPCGINRMVFFLSLMAEMIGSMSQVFFLCTAPA
jgi:hypothetical protein